MCIPETTFLQEIAIFLLYINNTFIVLSLAGIHLISKILLSLPVT